MSFGYAKAIDLAWNALAWRALQALVGIVAYRVFMKSLIRLTKTDEVSCQVNAAVSLSTINVSTVWYLCSGRQRGAARMVVGWLVLSVVYLLAFPTVMDAVCGYQATQLTIVSELSQMLSLGAVAADEVFGAQIAFWRYGRCDSRS